MRGDTTPLPMPESPATLTWKSLKSGVLQPPFLCHASESSAPIRWSRAEGIPYSIAAALFFFF